MQTLTRSALRSLAAVGLLILLLASSVGAVSAIPPYRIVDLGTLGGDSSAAYGVNGAGEVVGMSYLTGNVVGSDGTPAYHAVLFSHGLMKDLGTLGGSSSQARDINDAGQIVGTSTTADGATHAFLYSSGAMQDLGTLGGKESEGSGINDLGQVVGRAQTANGDVHAFLYSDGVMHDLGALADAPFSAAYHLNHAGQVAGFAFQPTGWPPFYAILDNGGVMQKLTGVSGTEARDINDAGQLVGQSGGHAFLYSAGVLTDLGTLLPGDAWSEGLGVNNLSQVVGTSGSAPFLCSSGVMTDLNSLVSSGLGWNLGEAWDINDAGQIAGTGAIHGQRHAFLLTPLSVPVIGARVQVDATAVDFGAVAVSATSAAQSVKVTNTGDAPLTITGASLAGADPGDFAATGGTGITLPANGTTSLTLTFTPTAAGSRNASLVVAGDAGGSPTSVALTGTGAAPVAAPRGIASISPAQLDFGPQPVGTSNGTQVFILQNTGSGPLTIAGASLSGANPADFAIAADGWSGTQLAPGQVATLSIRFTPTVIGSRAASLVVTDDAVASPQLVPLAGTGTAPIASLSTPNLNFADQLVGTTSAEQAFTLTNTGTAPLVLGDVTLAGTNAADFTAVVDPGSLALTPGESRTIHISFRPTAAGSRAATLVITDSADGSPQTVALTGSGTAPSISFGISRLAGPGALSFGSVALGSSGATQTLTLTNSGTAPLTIHSLAVTGANAGDYRITADSGGATVPPGGTRTLTVRFTPMAQGSRRAALTISDNAGGGQQTIALDGTGSLPAGGSPGSGAIPTGVSLVIDSVDGAAVVGQALGSNKVLVVSPGQHVTLKLLAKFPNGAVADVTGDANSHIGLGAPMGQFTAKHTWMARPADAGRLVTFYGSYRSLAGGRQLVGTVKLSVRALRRR